MIDTQKLTAGIVTSVLFAFVVSPVAFAAGDVEVTVADNGAHSKSTVEVTVEESTMVEQTSVTIAATNVYNKADTGNNKISGSTGSGSTQSIQSGNAEAVTSVKVQGGDTAAVVTSCGCENTTTVGVNGNGANSVQTVKLKLNTKKKVLQQSATEALTEVVNAAKTGKNSIKNSTGASKVKVESGSSKSTTDVVVKGGSVLLES